VRRADHERSGYAIRRFRACEHNSTLKFPLILQGMRWGARDEIRSAREGTIETLGDMRLVKRGSITTKSPIVLDTGHDIWDNRCTFSIQKRVGYLKKAKSF